jgi:hypothetical protein
MNKSKRSSSKNKYFVSKDTPSCWNSIIPPRHIMKRHTPHVGLYSRVPITFRLLGTFSAYEVLRCSYLRLHNLVNHNELIHSCFCLLVKT